jgi:hypothetical protein
MESVTVPEQPSSFLENLNSLCKINLSTGGSFITDPGLDVNDIVGILQILCELVNIKTKNHDHVSQDVARAYSVIPTFIINIAKRSRFDSAGYRLLKRCIRHAMDSYAVDVHQSNISVVKVNGEIALLMKHKVRASMRSEVHDVKVCFTKSTIVACECTCKCGSQGNEEILCTHVLPCLYQITLFIFDGLAEHVLIEFASFIATLNESDFSEENISDLQQVITKLVFAASKSIISNIGDESGYTMIRSMLNNYAVGTDKHKKLPNPPTDRQQLLALRDLDRRSGVKKAKDLISDRTAIHTVPTLDAVVDEGDVSAMLPSQYSNIMCSCWEICRQLKQKSISTFMDDVIGFKILAHRSVTGKTFQQLSRVDISVNIVRDVSDLLISGNGEIPVRKYTHGDVIVIDDCSLTDVENRVNDTITDEAEPNMLVDDEDFNLVDNLDLEHDPVLGNNDDISFVSNIGNSIDVDKVIPVFDLPNTRSKRMTCCVCNISNRLNSKLTFSKIPNTTIVITDKSTDSKRFQLAKENFRRKIYLHRLGIRSTNTKYLTFCNSHAMQTEFFDIPYKTRGGQRVVMNTKLVVPKDLRAAMLPSTRANRLLIYSPPPRRKRKSGVLDGDNKENSGDGGEIYTEDDEDESYNPKTGELERKRYRRCSFHKCESIWAHNMFRIPSTCTIIPKQYYNHNFERLLRASKHSHRHECLVRIGINNSTQSDDEVDYRICNKHPTETITKNVDFIDLKYNKQTIGIDMVVPIAYDNITNGTPHRTSNRYWRNKVESTKHLSVELAQQLGIDEEQLKNVLMQTLKSTTSHQTPVTQVDCSTSDTVDDIKKMKVLLKSHNNKFKHRTPKVLLSDMDDRTISFLTGFPSLSAMICFVIIMEQGDINKIISKRVTRSLTWFEEWLVVLERLWGRSLSRWTDASLKYGLSERQLSDLFDKKIQLIKRMRLVWGRFATYNEDKDLRQVKWESDFSTSRLVMWDNTNVPLCFLPTDAEAQRNTYSLYYGGNVGKGGVYIQPCGWMGTHELWVGSVSDTEYMMKSSAFETQQRFIEERDPLSSHVPWLNMLDKGYRNIGGHAFQNGRQLVVQPNFAKSDERFNTYQTLRSASVAKIRAGNERAVRNVKNSKFISSGLKANESITRLCDVWLCWGYQVNFMFRPVH